MIVLSSKSSCGFATMEKLFRSANSLVCSSVVPVAGHWRLPPSSIRVSQLSPRSPHPGQAGRMSLKHFRRGNDYALWCLGSGAKISGSYTDLMSEFSVRYLRY
jgi:hypothetical protein